MRGLPEFLEHRLANGLRVLVGEVHSLPLVSYQVHFAAGSRYERPGITGITHLFEHMMFKGTKELGPEEFSRIIQANGGTLNAFTTTDNTSYYENLPADKLELAVRLEADRLENLRLTQESLEPEREVVRSERKLRSVNSPFGLLIEQLFALAYEQHPYRWPVIGWDHDLRDLTLEDCREYYRTHYSPNNAVVVVVGDAVADEVFKMVEKYYSHMPSQPPPRLTIPMEKPQRGEKRAVFKKVSQVAAFFAAFHIPGITHPDLFPSQILCAVLSAGRSSRFFEKFEKPGKAVEARAEMGYPPFFSMDPGLLQIYAIVSPSISLETLEKEIWEEVETLRQQPISPEELLKVKKQVRSYFIQGLQTLFFKGLLAGLYQVRAGDFRLLYTIFSGYEAVTADDLLRVARKYLRPENRTIVTLQPVSPSEHEDLGELE
ncbi:MAG: insulinase family protein [Deltaproteobacteria bacterium]|nr:insulinase family protein [Deltaproteobacteria bacterium]